MRIGSLLLYSLCLVGEVIADTEIINFHLPIPPSSSTQQTSLPESPSIHSILTPDQPLITNLSSTSPELHFLLDFAQQDKQYNGWTIRVSWPGSSPTRISITPPDSSLHFSISGTPLSPRMPHPLLSHLPPSLKLIFSQVPTQAQDIQVDREEGFITPISIILEPLILGVIPRTAMSTVYLIFLGVIIAALSLSSVFRLIEHLINEFNDEPRGIRKVE